MADAEGAGGRGEEEEEDRNAVLYPVLKVKELCCDLGGYGHKDILLMQYVTELAAEELAPQHRCLGARRALHLLPAFVIYTYGRNSQHCLAHCAKTFRVEEGKAILEPFRAGGRYAFIGKLVEDEFSSMR